jgi:hypothetical protein
MQPNNGLTSDSIRLEYERRLAEAEREIARLTAKSRYFSQARAIVFFAAAAAFGHGWFSGRGGGWYVAGGLLAVAFLILITLHEFLLVRLGRCQILAQLQLEGIARIDRNWNRLPLQDLEIPARFRAVSDDLDIFGPHSLFHLIGTPRTPAGTRRLRDWLIEPASSEQVAHRQQAVRDLGPRLDLREEFFLESRLLDANGKSIEQFIAWAEAEPWLRRAPWLVGLCRCCPVTVLSALTLTATQRITVEHGFYIFVSALVVNVVILVLFAGRVHELFQAINRGGNEVRRFAALFRLLGGAADSDPLINQLQQRASLEDGGIAMAMRRLQRITRLANIQHSAIFFIFVYIPLQFLLLFDFHLLWLYESWQQKYAGRVRDWFEALGEFEALTAFATLHYEQPQWTFPRINVGSGRISAKNLGHPLIPDARRVGNDLEVGPPGRVLLVTGSNMSGKSTLLRSLGVCTVLAQAGAPVSADAFEMPPVRLATSVRIRDSLASGVSFYMAELLRLKEIVDSARQIPADSAWMLLYLLDEILLGTNSRERHIAVEQVLEYLLNQQAIGAITTHDLELASSPRIAQRCDCVHFRETILGMESERPIAFDYKLRTGVSTTTNALALLKIVGLSQLPPPQ